MAKGKRLKLNINIRKIFPIVLFLLMLVLIFTGYLSHSLPKKVLNLIPPETTFVAQELMVENKVDFQFPYVYKVSAVPPPVSAKAYLVVDLKTDTDIYGKNETVPLPPASVTKIMTAVIALEDYDLSRQVSVPQKCIGLNGSSVGYRIGEIFTLEDLLYGLLVRSGADSACAIANISNEVEFIARMNQKAKDLQMANTKFQNEIGFDAQNQHLTTVEDLKKLTKHALKFSAFRKIVGTKTVDVRSLNTSSVYRLQNTNDLLFSIPGTVGIKTGSTTQAKECLAYLYENKGIEIMILLLGSQNRFKDTIDLLNWAKVEIQNPVKTDKRVNQTIMPADSR